MQLFTAQLDDWFLNILDITDSVAMAIVRHEFVNTDGAYMQHMGNRPREISFRSYWFGISNDVGEVRQANYSNHYDFLSAMGDSSISHTLIHPKYGVCEGYVESLSMIHDDTQDYVVIDIKFVQKDIQTLGFIPVDTILVVDEMAIQGLNNALANSSTNMSTLGASSLLGKTIDFTQTVSSQINNVSQDLKAFCEEIDTNLDNFDTFLHDVTAPLTSIDASIAYIQDIPSRICQSINNVCNRLITSLADIQNFPVLFTNNLTLGLDNLYNTITGTNANFFQVQFRRISCISMLTQSGSLLQTDENNRTIALSRENKQAFDINGNRINKVTFEPFMSTNDLEAMTSITRKYAQKALILDRSNADIKNMASALMQYVNDIKLKRLSVKTITVSNMPIHALLQQLGLPYEASDRILSLNPGIINPNFITGQIHVYVS